MLKAEHSDVREALNSTRQELNDLRKRIKEMDVTFIQDELKLQSMAIAKLINLTTLVRATNNFLVWFSMQCRQ